MFDDKIIKNNDSPTRYDDTNKLLWTSNKKSNVTSLGKEKRGLFLFNEAVKKSIKYMYLNNNSFSNVDSLGDFKNIIELQLQCNSELSNIDGLKEHENLEILTLHNCSLTSLVDFSSENPENKTKASKLSKLTLQGNVNLGSLSGIDDSKKIIYLIANNCNLTDIDSLKNHSQVTYLDLATNINLVNVKNIKDCKALQYIYLDNNVKMSAQELNEALNSKISSDKETVLISQCLNSYKNIPKIYWDLFYGASDIIDFSYEAIGVYLTDDSPKWIGLMNKTNIKKLNLDGQTELSNESLQNTLSGLSGMRALKLNGLSNLTSLNFLSGMKNSIFELDVRDISTNCVDWSILNECLSLNRLLFTNNSINLEELDVFINRLRNVGCQEIDTWIGIQGWRASGLIYCGEEQLTFPSTTLITSFTSYNSDQEITTQIDLSGLTNLKSISVGGLRGMINLPKSVSEIEIQHANRGLEFTFSGQGEVHLNSLYSGWMDNSHGLMMKGAIESGRIDSWETGCSTISSLSFLNGMNVNKFSVTDMPAEANFDFSGVEGCSGLTELYVNGMRDNKPWTALNLDKVFENKSLQKLTIVHSRGGNWSGLGEMNQLKKLFLYDDAITDISFCKNLEEINEDLTISNNNVIDLTPLVVAIGDDDRINYTSLDISNNSLDGYIGGNNIEALLKLHKAGLQKVTIIGNYFTPNEINKLKNGMTINGVTYEGFGSENVIN